MDALTGVTTTRELYLERLGVPLTGAILTYTLTPPSGTASLSAAAVTEDSGGWYFINVDGSTYLTTPGTYHEVWTGSSGTVDLYWAERFRVGTPTGPLMTRRELRHSVARRCGDLKLGVATSASGTTIADTQLAGADDEWRGAYVYIYAGTGIGQERKATDYVASTGVITVPTWTPQPDTTSRFELHKRAQVEEYNDAINSAIREAAMTALVDLTDESLTVSSDTVWEYTIPDGFAYLAEVWQLNTADTAADWVALLGRAPERPLGTGDWSVVPGRNKLRLRQPTTTTRLRLVGQGLPDVLSRDSQYCDLAPTFVEFQAAANLLLNFVRGPEQDRDGLSQRVPLLLNRAQAVRPRRRPRPDSVRVN